MPDMPGYTCPVEGCGFDIEGRMVSDPDFAAAMDAHILGHEYPSIPEVEQSIIDHGFTLRYVQYAEDSRTPGFLGQIRGVTDWTEREVKIAMKHTKTWHELYEILLHELRHIEHPDWDCGNRDVFGRGGPKRPPESQVIADYEKLVGDVVDALDEIRDLPVPRFGGALIVDHLGKARLHAENLQGYVQNAKREASGG